MWNELTYVRTIERRVHVRVYHLIQWFQGIFSLSKRIEEWVERMSIFISDIQEYKNKYI